MDGAPEIGVGGAEEGRILQSSSSTGKLGATANEVWEDREAVGRRGVVHQEGQGDLDADHYHAHVYSQPEAVGGRNVEDHREQISSEDEKLSSNRSLSVSSSNGGL